MSAVRRIALAGTIALAALTSAPPAWAVRGATPSPAVASVAFGAAARVPLVWTVVIEGVPPVRSERGRLLTARGTVVATVGTVLEGRTAGAAVQTLPETLSIPVSAMEAAIAEGHRSLLYEREFSEIRATATATGRLSITIAGVPSSCGLDRVEALPPTVPVAIGQAPILSVRWIARFRPGQPAAPIASGSGTFLLPSGALLGEGGGALTLTAAGAQSSALEQIVVPREVIYRAWRAGAARIVYARAFGDDTCAQAGRVVMDITGGGAAGFGIQRIALHFADGALARIVGAGDRLVAYADVTASGTGFLEGAWEVADLAPGTRVYRTLSLVSEHLLGSSTRSLVSPPLPTGARGPYLLRFRVTSPRGVEEPPTLRYVVGSGATNPAGGPLSSWEVEGPDLRAPASAGARFRWRPVPDARAYLIEFRETGPGERLVSGMLIPAERSEANLSAAASGHLAAGRPYRWRILALGEGGATLAASPPRDFRTP